MNSTPPITYFANSLFLHMAPYGRGRVVLKGADTAMSVNVYTTTGILVPGIIKKGTEVKIVFRDDRIGEITDMFCVPASELTKEQVAKKGLQTSEINWESPAEPALPKATAKETEAYNEALKEMKSVIEEMNLTERARKDIADWKRDILVKTSAGSSAFIGDGEIRLKRRTASPDFVMCVQTRALARRAGLPGCDHRFRDQQETLDQQEHGVQHDLQTGPHGALGCPVEEVSSNT